MRLRAFLFAFSPLLGSALVMAAAPRGKSPAAPSSSSKAVSPVVRDVVPFLTRRCLECHGAKKSGGVDLRGVRDEASLAQQRELMDRVVRMIESGVMPPKEKPQPSAAERGKVVSLIETTLAASCDLKDPGRVTLRRLNREEYNNTIRDLFGIALRPADHFPSDDVGYGFDNIGDVLTISPLLMERYLSAAEKVAETAIWSAESSTRTLRFDAEDPRETQGQGVIERNVRTLYQVGEVRADVEFPQDGEYLLRARAYATSFDGAPVRMGLKLDGTMLLEINVAARSVAQAPAAAQVYEHKMTVQSGKRRFAAAYLVAPLDPSDGSVGMDRASRDPRRRLSIDYLEVTGPIEPKPNPLPASHRRLVRVEPKSDNPRDSASERVDCVKRILTPFLKRAFRRPVTPDEVARGARAAEMAFAEGESFERGVQLAVQAALVSPHFLFKVELDSGGGNAKTARALNDYELASRLSYFLWCSMPDDELFALADRGALRDPKALEAQARRMLRDPKARALVDNFAAQWLQLRNLALINPDQKQFPAFSDELRADMRHETEMFFEAVVREDRSILDFIDGKFTFVNERLAQHYGLSGVQGDSFRRVALDGNQRAGVITQASVLMVTSNPTRTSPVKRGKWILEQVFNDPPPPPLPGVDALKDDEEAVLKGSLRQRMEQHRANPRCAVCHTRMDALGFGFENYDAIGQWRTMDGRFAIDSSGTLPDGKSFKTPAQLRAILKSQSKQFARCFAEKLLIFALGRGLNTADRCAVDELVGSVTTDGYRFTSVVAGIVKSEPFRMKRAEESRRADGGQKS